MSATPDSLGIRALAREHIPSVQYRAMRRSSKIAF